MFSQNCGVGLSLKLGLSHQFCAPDERAASRPPFAYSWMAGPRPGHDGRLNSRTPGRAATRVALHAGAVTHQSEVAALRAHLAFVALGFSFGAAFGFGRRRGLSCTGLAPLHRLELFRWREVVAYFLLQRDRALYGVGGDAGMNAAR